MRHMPRHFLALPAAFALAILPSAPADARHYRHWNGDGVELGDLVVGAIVIGGIAILVSEIARARDNDGTIFGNDRKRRSSAENAAVEACASAAQRRVREEGHNGRVRDITDVQRLGDSLRVRGVVVYRPSGDWSRDGGYDWSSARFTCSYTLGRIDYVRLDDGYAWR